MKNLDEFRSLLSKAVTMHYSKVNTDLDGLYGYALYTSDCLSSIGGVCNTNGDISVSSSDSMYNYYRYGAVEWQHFDDYGMFDEVNSLLREIMDFNEDDSDEDSWYNQKILVLEACLEQLVLLDSAGLFGSKNSGRFIVICLSDSGNSIMDKSAKELNNNEIYEAYSKEFTC